MEHLTQKQVGDYCRQRLNVAELLPVSDHLGECEACQRLIEYAMNGDAAFFALRAEVFSEAAESTSPRLLRAHLCAEQTAGYVDRNLSGEELQTVADHLTNCEQCALAVDDLDAFRDQIASSLDREYHPASVSSPKVITNQGTRPAAELADGYGEIGKRVFRDRADWKSADE